MVFEYSLGANERERVLEKLPVEVVAKVPPAEVPRMVTEVDPAFVVRSDFLEKSLRFTVIAEETLFVFRI